MDRLFIEHLFTAPPMAKEQKVRSDAILSDARDLAFLIDNLCPDSHDKYTALRHLRDVTIYARHAILSEMSRE